MVVTVVMRVMVEEERQGLSEEPWAQSCRCILMWWNGSDMIRVVMVVVRKMQELGRKSSGGDRRRSVEQELTKRTEKEAKLLLTSKQPAKAP
jgi:hypothetical protein